MYVQGCPSSSGSWLSWDLCPEVFKFISLLIFVQGCPRSSGNWDLCPGVSMFIWHLRLMSKCVQVHLSVKSYVQGCPILSVGWFMSRGVQGHLADEILCLGVSKFIWQARFMSRGVQVNLMANLCSGVSKFISQLRFMSRCVQASHTISC